MNNKALAGLLAAAMISLPTHAALLTFDDLTLAFDTPQELADGYQGLNWTNFFALNPGDNTAGNGYLNSGYLNGRESPPNVAFNGNADPASFSSTTPFLLTSGYFAAAWVNGLSISFTGSLGGSQVFARTETVSSTKSLFIEFGQTIDLLTISTACVVGTCSAASDVTGTGNNFVLDNLRIGEPVNPVPEPGALALIASGLLGLGLMRTARANGRAST